MSAVVAAPAASATIGRLATPARLESLMLVLLVVPLVYLGVKLVRQLKARRAPARPRLALRRTWTAFLRRTPPQQRRALALFQPFIVLGDLGAGKTALIDRHLDWRGHAAQFQPSHVDDPLLQIYRGASAVVQELSPLLLDDTSPAARAALARLWRPLRRGRAPVVVLALDVGRLLRATPEQLQRRAQLVRGKLDLLAELLRRPATVTLVVTKADQLPGFIELARLLRDRGMPLSVQPTKEGALGPAFAAFEPLLPALLAQTAAPAYLRLLAFFDELPALLAPLETFVRTLRSSGSAAPEPIVGAVALHATDESGALQPFAASISAADVRRFHPLRRHALVAGGVAAVALALMIGGYQAARARLDRGSLQLAALLDAPGDGAAQAAWLTALDDARRSPARRWLPRFFAGDPRFGDAELRRRFVHGVRARLLEPWLGRSKSGSERLYALSLLYASNRDPLGKLVLAHLGQWANGLALPPSLVRAYVEAVEAGKTPPPVVAGDGGELARPAAALALEPAVLSRWLAELQQRLTQPYLAADELQQLQRQAAQAHHEAQRVAERQNLARAAELLADELGLAASAPAQHAAADADPLPDAVLQLAALVEGSRLEQPDVARLDLAQLVAQLGQLVASPPPSRQPIAFSFADQPFSFDPAAWERLLVRSRVTLMTRAFVAREDEDSEALFAAPGNYPPLTVSARGDGCNFAGGARIEGQYTARAFADHVAAPLAELPRLLGSLPLSAADAEQLGDRIVEATGAYADAYAAQYRALVGSLRCRARSSLELRQLLTQLPSSGSPLRAALREIARNTALTLPRDNPYAAPLEALSDEFAALRALAPATGPATQLDGWVAVLRSMEAAIDGRAPAGNDKEPADSLRNRLPPLGRLALAIYRRDEDSPKLQLERWLTAANLDSEWWPAFSAPVDEANALGRRELQKTLGELWTELVQTGVQPLAETFPFKRDAEAAATMALVETALAPKQPFWSTFEAAIAPLLIGTRDGWQPRDGHGSSLLPANLLATANRLAVLSLLLWDKDGKPRPLLMRVRPLPLAIARGDAPVVLTSYLQVGGATVYGFNQRADWTTLKIEWWKPESAAVGVAIGGGEAGRSYRAVTVADTPWSLWRLLQRASSDDTRVFTWSVAGPDGRALSVQFELKDDPWTRFALL